MYICTYNILVQSIVRKTIRNSNLLLSYRIHDIIKNLLDVSRKRRGAKKLCILSNGKLWYHFPLDIKYTSSVWMKKVFARQTNTVVETKTGSLPKKHRAPAFDIPS